jgi:nitrate/TMAO reductase-like tetraheme cytochrome c subunit
MGPETGPGLWLVIGIMALSLVLALFVGFRAGLTRDRRGKMFAFVGLFILPVLAVWLGFREQMTRAESTRFCLSCHAMSDWGKSLYIDDPSVFPAVHFQNHLIPADHACYTCHTTYTFFGPLKSKIEGLRHMYVEYLGTIPPPAKIKLYTPYDNRECLYCHGGARDFLQVDKHNKPAGEMAKIMSNQVSCMAANCHDTIHAIEDLKDVTFWKRGK